MRCSKLVTVTFEQGSKLETIGGRSGTNAVKHGAFTDCPRLTTIDASNCTQLSRIEEYAFYEANRLELFKIGATSHPFCGTYAFEGIKENSTLQVPSGCISEYKNTEGWKEFASIIEAE